MRLCLQPSLEVSMLSSESQPLKTTQPWMMIVMVLAVFLCYLTISAPLAVIPIFVHDSLNINNFGVGVAVGIHFLATVLTRPYAGRLSDNVSSKRATLQGILALLVTAVFYYLATVLSFGTTVSFILLLVGRICHGYAESLLISGHIAWGLSLFGQQQAGRLLSLTGMAIFGALAVGAPIGLTLFNHFGFSSLVILLLLMPVLAFALYFPIHAVKVHKGAPLALKQVMAYVWKYGLILALQGVGFACIGTFIVLYFKAQGWLYSEFALASFGVAFVLVRIFAGHSTDHYSGYWIAGISLLVELLGLSVIFIAPNAQLAIVGTFLTGMGCSLVYPALGVELIKQAPVQVRGTAMSVYSAFQDISYAVCAPLFGLIALQFNYATTFMLAACCVAFGWILNWRMARHV
ncbi:arabinose transporter [Acinetobacter populi]|uniref:Arabinose transporter n=2 Tax=Acinetobacter populi TaxID=1582270 RepID=A0A1Z9YTT7_9GAMM|nr:arabinose transporter [Acinetobacter populi]